MYRVNRINKPILICRECATATNTYFIYNTRNRFLVLCKKCAAFKEKKMVALGDIEKAREIKMKQMQKEKDAKENPVIKKWVDPFIKD